MLIDNILKRHRLINRDINIRASIESSDKRILFDISEQSSETNEENLMENITMSLDSTNKLEHWYVRRNNVYCLHPWATCFNLYTGHLQALLYT